VFVQNAIAVPLLLSERDALLSRAAEIFRCNVPSLLIDMRTCRLRTAAEEAEAEIDDLDEMWNRGDDE
jgi:hypothetical protein